MSDQQTAPVMTAWRVDQREFMIQEFSYERRTPTFYFGCKWSRNIGSSEGLINGTVPKKIRKFQLNGNGRHVLGNLTDAINCLRHELIQRSRPMMWELSRLDSIEKSLMAHLQKPLAKPQK